LEIEQDFTLLLSTSDIRCYQRN